MYSIKPIILFWLLGLGAVVVHGQNKDVPKNVKDTAGLTKVDNLKAAIVTATMRPHMRGDTLEYNTEHLQMHTNAVVEDLLRRLPGLHIDPDGTITYNGEKIDHLLVDGQDIFGSSPTIVTQNFDASKISRVQILDRRSDQALFTGVDDGTRMKTLNLVLKNDARNGYFGKVEVGGNTDNYYKADGYVAGFRDKEQFTAIGLASNTGVLSFSSNSTGSSPGVTFTTNVVDPLGASAGMGIPHFVASALHYANTWDGGDQHFLTNYQYSHYFTQPVTTTLMVQAQPDSVYSQNQQSNSVNRQDQHWMFGVYDWTINKVSALRINFHGGTANGQNYYVAKQSSQFNDTLVNSSYRTINDNLSQQSFGGDIDWRIQGGREKNRVFSVIAAYGRTDNVTNGSIYSQDQFYQPNGQLQSADTIDQHKQITSHAVDLAGIINFTQPIWKNGMLALGYTLSVNTDHPLQATYNRGDGKYTELIDSLSSHYKEQTINQHVTINLQGKVARIHYTIGTDLLDYHYQQKDLIRDSLLSMHHINWAPRVMLTYTPNPATNFNFNYNASTQQPSIAQLTPIQNNTNPLHITIGNPDLKPGFNQNFRLDFRRLKAWMFNATITAALNSNSISTKTITDSLGRQISQPVNVSGGRTLTSFFMVSKKMLGIDLGLHVNGNYARTVNYVNADLSNNDIYSGGFGLNLNKYVADRYSFQFTTNFAYFDQVSSINTSAPVHYWTQGHQGSVTIFLLKDFELNTNANYTWQEKTSAFSSSTSVMLWNAYVNRNFANGKWVARFQVNNILDANAGINRKSINNTNTETSTNILGRYWMLSIGYHFDRKFKTHEKPAP